MQSSSHSYLSFLEKSRPHNPIQRNMLLVAVHTLPSSRIRTSIGSNTHLFFLQQQQPFPSITSASHMGNNTPQLQMVWPSTYVWTNSSFSIKFHFQGTLLKYCYPLLLASTNIQHYLFFLRRESFFFLPWWQKQINALSSSPNISPFQTKFSCGSSNPSWPTPSVTQLPSYQKYSYQAGFAGGHGHSNITSNGAVFHSDTNWKTFVYYSLSFSFSMNKANSVAVLLC